MIDQPASKHRVLVGKAWHRREGLPDESLRAGQKIELRGFGSFRLRSRKSRTGRNPKTGEKVEVPSKKIPYFKPGKELKELINKALVEVVASDTASSASE